jgi:hypothetical protein
MRLDWSAQTDRIIKVAVAVATSKSLTTPQPTETYESAESLAYVINTTQHLRQRPEPREYALHTFTPE